MTGRWRDRVALAHPSETSEQIGENSMIRKSLALAVLATVRRSGRRGSA